MEEDGRIKQRAAEKKVIDLKNRIRLEKAAQDASDEEREIMFQANVQTLVDARFKNRAARGKASTAGGGGKSKGKASGKGAARSTKKKQYKRLKSS